MPPKGMGGGGIFSAMYFVLTLPFKIVANIVYYPSSFFMWVVADCLGDDKWCKTWQWKEWMKSQKDIMDFVKATKQFRVVLFQFGWPSVKSPAWRCKACPAAGAYWCIDCGKKFCAQCAYNIHTPGSIAMLHSIEEIDKEGPKKKGVHLLSPIIAELAFLWLVMRAATDFPFVHSDYLTTQNTCPVTLRFRGFVGWLDTNLLYHYKKTYFQWCDVEDSFLRFILDLWVRDIVTSTDNTALIFQTLPQATLFYVVLTHVMVPILSLIYAFVLNAIYQIECFIPRTEFLEKAESFVGYFAFFDYFDLSYWWDVPPKTKSRCRPPKDTHDRLTYWWRRKLRIFSYYYNTNRETLKCLNERLLAAVMFLRLGCIWLGLGAPLRGICSLFLWRTMEIHAQRFQKASNMIVNEQLLRSIFGTTFQGSARLLLRGPMLVRHATGIFVASSAAVVAGLFFFCYTLLQERQRFMAKWMGTKDQDGNYIPGTMYEYLDFAQPLTLQQRNADGGTDDSPRLGKFASVYSIR